MFRILLTAAILSMVEPSEWFPPSVCGSENSQIEVQLNSLVQELIEVDRKVQLFCIQHQNIGTLETLGENSYKLQVTLPENNAKFDIRIKHRLIYINVHEPHTQECDLTYADVRVLPDFVNTHRAIWRFQNRVLTVAFPYKYSLSVPTTLSCDRNIDDSVIHVKRVQQNDPLYS